MADLLTIPEFSDLLRITKTTAYTWISRRRIPHLKLGRSIRIRRADALKLLREVPAVRPLGELEDPRDGGNGGGE
jgi:excisionase family DNA binding protein